MTIELYQVDAFTGKMFGGNPAAVCPLETWLDDSVLQSIAAENNLSETAFFVGQDGSYELRWFTPTNEVELCGHATLATAYVIFNFIDPQLLRTLFQTQSGELIVERNDTMLTMNFPSNVGEPMPVSAKLIEALGKEPKEAFEALYYHVIFDCEEDVRSLQPNMSMLCEYERIGFIASAPGENSDFVSRFFAPKVGIPEDPVTGSAHCTLTPYWSQRLGKKELHAFQISQRGGELFCRDEGDRVNISGHAVLYLRGEIELPER